MYNGLSKKLSSTELILNLAIMYDVLAELSMLSESLQGNNRLLCRQTDPEEYPFFEEMKEKPGAETLEAKDPQPYVKTWLQKHRTADDTRTRQSNSQNQWNLKNPTCLESFF